MIIEEDVYLEHFGVKGMRWGVRREQIPNGGKSNVQIDKKTLAKKAAIGLGILTVAVGAAYAANSMNQNGSLRLGEKKPPSRAIQSAVERTFQPPTSVIHASRGKNRGFTFLKQGDTPDYFTAYEKTGLPEATGEFLKPSPDGSVQKIDKFLDPNGRTDRAGRNIPHGVVIPVSMASNINSLADVKEQIWPLLRDQYDSFYEDSL